MRNKLTIPDTIEIPLTSGDIEGGLSEQKGLWLGRYTLDELRDDFERFGILPHLKERGYTRVTPHMETQPFEGTLRITGTANGKEHLLVEVVTRRTTESLIGDFGERPYSTLVIDWVRFQDPCAEFGEGHPRLPGQEHPGLHLLRKGTALMVDHVRGLDVDLVLTYPQHFHNAIFYSSKFRFLDPVTEGHFRALCRDLKNDGLANASRALEEGRVRDSSGHPVYWLSKAQVFPQTPSIEKELFNKDYELAVQKAQAQKFILVD
jgi:hypothetical protein